MAKSDKPSILFLDDDEIILVALAETLQPAGYRIVQASDPIRAVELIKNDKFAVIISDQRMPNMTGLEFLSEAKKLQPNASRILITGVLTLNTVIDAINKGEIFRFLAKPWIREELLATVQNAVQRFQLLEVNQKLQADTLKLNERLSESNTQLQQNIKQLTEQKIRLDVANKALGQNFDHSLELCYRIISTYHPGLGKETKAIVDLCRQMIDTGYFNPEEEHILKVSAWLQNIGLLGVSRELLATSRQSPESLNPTDRRIIHNHPIYGQTLASFVENLESVGATIRAHHERWDGKGYPDGLSGEIIPRPARFLAVVVFFVECGFSRQEAIEAILEQSGKAFEPEAVRFFLKVTRMMQLPKKVREILFSELKPGMILAQGISNPMGLLLVPEGATLSENTLAKIQDHNIVDPVNHRLLVYH